ncbi:MAG TPA: hypothetical protein VKK61_03730 [Tepidisphaeraceae bacterium]|nr:hypothetical protein [Tepidisphaeraceae bacterium]
MVQELVNLLPHDGGSFGLIVAIVGSLIGMLIWLVGSRFSRPIVTLATVTLGAIIGMHLPAWFGWNISGAGPAVGAALILGVTGYVLHGMWVGIGLGTVLASWAAMACWILFRNGANMTWPPISTDTNLFEYCKTVWQQLPADVTRLLPYACATAMVSGVAAAIVWPRLSLILGWSMAGATLLAGMGVAAVDYGKPQWLGHVPQPMWAQGVLLASLVTLGALVQWKLGPKPAGATKKKPKAESQTS